MCFVAWVWGEGVVHWSLSLSRWWLMRFFSLGEVSDFNFCFTIWWIGGHVYRVLVLFFILFLFIFRIHGFALPSIVFFFRLSLLYQLSFVVLDCCWAFFPWVGLLCYLLFFFFFFLQILVQKICWAFFLLESRINKFFILFYLRVFLIFFF